jgi:hypothetical protein
MYRSLTLPPTPRYNAVGQLCPLPNRKTGHGQSRCSRRLSSLCQVFARRVILSRAVDLDPCHEKHT